MRPIRPDARGAAWKFPSGPLDTGPGRSRDFWQRPAAPNPLCDSARFEMRQG